MTLKDWNTKYQTQLGDASSEVSIQENFIQK